MVVLKWMGDVRSPSGADGLDIPLPWKYSGRPHHYGCPCITLTEDLFAGSPFFPSVDRFMYYKSEMLIS